MTETRTLAKKLAEAGFPVLPCKRDGTPIWDIIGKEGATKSATTIGAWWQGTGSYHVGLARKQGARKVWEVVLAENADREDLDDCITELKARAKEKPNGKAKKPNGAAEPEATPLPQMQTRNLAEVHEAFRHWFSDEYDLDGLNATLACAAAERLDGDPLWLLLVSGPGNTKTETVQTLRGAGAIVTGPISSVGALLSATAESEREADATGGLLRRLGDRGLLVLKDVSSILSMDRNTRAAVLAALREIYDGCWERNVGVGGGHTLIWKGRIGLIGAVTTAWDTHHGVVGALGDRFLLLRVDAGKGRQIIGRQAIKNTGQEVKMRSELAQVVGGLISTVKPEHAVTPTLAEENTILNLADITSLARTAAILDGQRYVVDMHAPEAPTRVGKQLTQLFRGAVAIGLSRRDALALVCRCARDTIPPARLDILRALNVGDDGRFGKREISRMARKTYSTTRREVDALFQLGLLECEEKQRADGEGSYGCTAWAATLVLSSCWVVPICENTPTSPTPSGGRGGVLTKRNHFAQLETRRNSR